MECFKCKNCEMEDDTYFCPMKNDFVVKEMKSIVIEKPKLKWKKGDPEYENHRRKSRKELELQIKE